MELCEWVHYSFIYLFYCLWTWVLCSLEHYRCWCCKRSWWCLWSAWLCVHIFLSRNIRVTYCQITMYPKLGNSKQQAFLRSFFSQFRWVRHLGRLSWMTPAQSPSQNCHKALVPSGEAVAPYQGPLSGERSPWGWITGWSQPRASLSLGWLLGQHKPLYELLSYRVMAEADFIFPEWDRQREGQKKRNRQRWKVRKIEIDTETDKMEIIVFTTLES